MKQLRRASSSLKYCAGDAINFGAANCKRELGRTSLRMGKLTDQSGNQKSSSENGTRPSICFVLTSPLVLNAFLLDHLRALADDYRITVCINTDESPVSSRLDTRVELIAFPIQRKVNPGRDFQSLVWLVRLFRRKRFSAVHSITPKGGLLGMLAAYICGIPMRTHIFTGQVWVTRTGFMRHVLKAMDRLLAICATDLMADSQSQARFLEQEGICKAGRIHVCGSGSVNGVNLTRFSHDPGRRERIRAELALPKDATVFLFMGRLNLEKGVLDLAEAFARLAMQHGSAFLVLVGPDEGHLANEIAGRLGSNRSRLRLVGLTSSPESYFDAADVLCLPSYREGFGSVVIEAAAMGVPAIASRIYGLTDAVVDGVTGILCPPGDPGALLIAMEEMLDGNVRHGLGAQARLRAQREFSTERLTAFWAMFYAQRLLGKPYESLSHRS